MVHLKRKKNRNGATLKSNFLAMHIKHAIKIRKNLKFSEEVGIEAVEAAEAVLSEILVKISDSSNQSFFKGASVTTEENLGKTQPVSSVLADKEKDIDKVEEAAAILSPGSGSGVAPAG